ncbi:MAG: nuclear transport factor 2 family protein [Bacteroidota bacterium]
MKKLIIIVLTIVSCMTVTAQEQNEAALVVEAQITAYNAGNLEAFAATYSDDVVFYEPSMQKSIQGKAQLKELFGNLFKNNPDLHCFIDQRIVSGDTVIDHEKVQIRKGQPLLEFVAMYKVKEGKIAEVYFLKRPN